jgi:hypothetical protein
MNYLLRYLYSKMEKNISITACVFWSWTNCIMHSYYLKLCTCSPDQEISLDS